MNPQDIQLTPEHQRRVAEVAARKGISWQEVLDEALVVRVRGGDGVTGLFADAPELADAIVVDAMATRESDLLRR